MIVQKRVQLDIFEAARRAEEGMQRAIDNANAKNDNWSDTAYAHFLQWLYKLPLHSKFMIEDFREAAKVLPPPPSNRAFGGLVKRAVNDKLIQHAGHGKTKNVKAHGTPASIWRKI